MSKTRDYVFVLWANEFDEVAATIFTTELRRAGLRVQLVGLTQRQSNGACGLALVPDLTLETALPLASRVICLVIPCPPEAVQWLRNDPRLPDFFRQAHANAAKFILEPLGTTDLELFPTTIDKVTIYPYSEDLIERARDVARSLATLI